MARDYKNRATSTRRKPQQNTVAWWKWLLIALLIAVFTIFLFFLKSTSPKQATVKQQTIAASTKPKPKPKHQNKVIQEPRYDFYTILPETEVIIPDYEINTRRREEHLGKRKASQYNVQAGSFRNFTDADKLRAKLALIGIESRVEKATIGSVVWNRVKMGPFRSSSQIAILKKRLKSNGIDIIVTETKG